MKRACHVVLAVLKIVPQPKLLVTLSLVLLRNANIERETRGAVETRRSNPTVILPGFCRGEFLLCLQIDPQASPTRA